VFSAPDPLNAAWLMVVQGQALDRLAGFFQTPLRASFFPMAFQDQDDAVAKWTYCGSFRM
jgi:hypothetical protein